jgi:hypothetical protein
MGLTYRSRLVREVYVPLGSSGWQGSRCGKVLCGLEGIVLNPKNWRELRQVTPLTTGIIRSSPGAVVRALCGLESVLACAGVNPAAVRSRGISLGSGVDALPRSLALWSSTDPRKFRISCIKGGPDVDALVMQSRGPAHVADWIRARSLTRTSRGICCPTRILPASA